MPGVFNLLSLLLVTAAVFGYINHKLLGAPGSIVDGVLSLLLFCGALNLEVEDLWRRRLTVLALATVGVVAILLVGLGIWGVWLLLGHPAPLLWFFVLGAAP